MSSADARTRKLIYIYIVHIRVCIVIFSVYMQPICRDILKWLEIILDCRIYEGQSRCGVVVRVNVTIARPTFNQSEE